MTIFTEDFVGVAVVEPKGVHFEIVAHLSIVVNALVEKVPVRSLDLQTDQFGEHVEHRLHVLQVNVEFRVHVNGQVFDVGKERGQVDQNAIQTVLSVHLHAVQVEGTDTRQIGRVDRGNLQEVFEKKLTADGQRGQAGRETEEQGK